MGLWERSKTLMRNPSDVRSNCTLFSVSSCCCRILARSSLIRRMVSISTAETDWNFPSALDEEVVSLFGMRPVDSLVTEEKGFRKARSTASFFLVVLGVKQSTLEKGLMG